MNDIHYIAFDADDTLWHNEVIFTEAQSKFRELLGGYHDQEWINRRLYRTERKNLEIFGYGIKGFTLSMIETAIELTEGRIRGDEVQQIIEVARRMLGKPIELLEGVQETLQGLEGRYEIWLISKGDLFDQETKLARSGLSEYFEHVEIVSEKNRETYRRLLKKYGVPVEHFLMVGNSLKSDILPVLELGGRAVHVPYHTEWIHERVEESALDGHEFQVISRLDALPGALEQL